MLHRLVPINKLVTAFIIGMNSGIIYALLGSTITAYLNDNHVPLTVIGLLSLRTLPYSFKYAWAYLVDSMHIKMFPKGFGQRKEWMVTAQILLIICMLILGSIDIEANLNLLFALAFFMAFLGATYDIGLEAYKIELFPKEELIIGSPVVVWGFRVGLLMSGALGLYLASIFSWQTVFMLMIIPIIPCIFILWFSEDERETKHEHSILDFRRWFRANILDAFVAIYKIPHFFSVLLVVSFYKLSDGFLDTILIPFLTSINFSKPEIAGLSQTASVFGVIFGTMAGAYLLRIANLWKVLFFAEIFAALTNLLFIFLIYYEKNIYMLAPISIVESFCSSICNIVLIFYMSSLCKDPRFVATHYAILIAASGFTRAMFCSMSGYIAAKLGWANFFIFSGLLSGPSLICILLLRDRVMQK